jgi:hypothetical protein
VSDQVQIIEYFYARVGNRPGEARRLLEHVSEKGINLLAFTFYPVGGGLTQLNFVTDRVERLKEAAADAQVELVGPERAFFIYGYDRVGALHDHLLKLSNAGVNVSMSSGVSDGAGRFGFIVYVEPEDFDQAASAFDFI